MYNYEELKEKAMAVNATKEDRMALFNWFERHGNMYWNGECYNIENGYGLYPVYESYDEENDLSDIVDAEIR